MKIKTCPFIIDGPVVQQMRGRAAGRYQLSGMYKLHSMQDWSNPLHQGAADYIQLPRMKFQAELRYQSLCGGRILMLDQYGRQWSIFGSSADEVLPKMQMGKLTAWWIMTKKGQACGLTVDLTTPLLAHVPPNQDVPQMLEKVQDLNTVMAEFAALAV